MKLHEMNEEIAKACDMRAKSVLMVQKETFRRLREMIEKGERVAIPGFGIFSTKEKPGAEGGEAKTSIRFKIQARDEQATEASADERKAKRQAKKLKNAAQGGAEVASDADVTTSNE